MTYFSSKYLLHSEIQADEYEAKYRLVHFCAYNGRFAPLEVVLHENEVILFDQRKPRVIGGRFTQFRPSRYYTNSCHIDIDRNLFQMSFEYASRSNDRWSYAFRDEYYDNDINNWNTAKHIFFFKKKEDALMFKLQFG